MEIIVIIAGCGLAAILIRNFSGTAPDHSRRNATTAKRPLKKAIQSSRQPVPVKASPPPTKQRTDSTPTPAGARRSQSLKHRRAQVLAERARCESGHRIRGRVWVVDGDTLVIDNHHIRLAGIDAPEIDHPYGKMSKWALVKLCKGQLVTAEIKPELSYDRVVAVCTLADGTDLAEALVRQGLALDWPSYSGGRYSRFEPEGVRKKLWKTAMRQRQPKRA